MTPRLYTDKSVRCAMCGKWRRWRNEDEMVFIDIWGYEVGLAVEGPEHMAWYPHLCRPCAAQIVMDMRYHPRRDEILRKLGVLKR